MQVLTSPSGRGSTCELLLLPNTTVRDTSDSPSGNLTSAPTTQAFSKVHPLPKDEFASTTFPSPTVHDSNLQPTCKWLLFPIVTGPLLQQGTRRRDRQV